MRMNIQFLVVFVGVFFLSINPKGCPGFQSLFAENNPGSGEGSAAAALAPAGLETYFPKGYTKPKMAVGGNSVGIVGPTPTFGEKKEMGSKTGVQESKVNDDDQELQSNAGSALKDGNTPLMVAAAKGDVESVRSLLRSRGTNVNSRNKFGSTALMGAAAGGFTPIVDALLKSGASVNAKGKGGATALNYAKKNGHDDTAKLLTDNGARDDTKPVSSNSNLKSNLIK